MRLSKPLPYKPKKDEEWSLRLSKPKDFIDSPETKIELKTLNKIEKALTKIPDGFKPLKQITKLISERENFLKINH